MYDGVTAQAGRRSDSSGLDVGQATGFEDGATVAVAPELGKGVSSLQISHISFVLVQEETFEESSSPVPAGE